MCDAQSYQVIEIEPLPEKKSPQPIDCGDLKTHDLLIASINQFHIFDHCRF